MSSTLTVTNLTATNLTDGGGTTSTFANINSGSAKAWFNSSSTALRTSFNVSSFVDNGTGDYTHNLTSAFNTEDYAAGTAGYSGSARTVVIDSANTASDVRVHTYLTSSGAQNDASSLVIVCGDRA